MKHLYKQYRLWYVYFDYKVMLFLDQRSLNPKDNNVIFIYITTRCGCRSVSSNRIQKVLNRRINNWKSFGVSNITTTINFTICSQPHRGSYCIIITEGQRGELAHHVTVNNRTAPWPLFLGVQAFAYTTKYINLNAWWIQSFFNQWNQHLMCCYLFFIHFTRNGTTHFFCFNY